MSLGGKKEEDRKEGWKDGKDGGKENRKELHSSVEKRGTCYEAWERTFEQSFNSSRDSLRTGRVHHNPAALKT